MVSTQVHYRQNQVPTGENGSDTKHLFQWRGHEEPKASQRFLKKSCWAVGLLCSHRFGAQLIEEEVPPNCSDFSEMCPLQGQHTQMPQGSEDPSIAMAVFLSAVILHVCQQLSLLCWTCAPWCYSFVSRAGAVEPQLMHYCHSHLAQEICPSSKVKSMNNNTV